jgi:hypothetical protein
LFLEKFCFKKILFLRIINIYVFPGPTTFLVVCRRPSRKLARLGDLGREEESTTTMGAVAVGEERAAAPPVEEVRAGTFCTIGDDLEALVVVVVVVPGVGAGG